MPPTFILALLALLSCSLLSDTQAIRRPAIINADGTTRANDQNTWHLNMPSVLNITGQDRVLFRWSFTYFQGAETEHNLIEVPDASHLATCDSTGGSVIHKASMNGKKVLGPWRRGSTHYFLGNLPYQCQYGLRLAVHVQ